MGEFAPYDSSPAAITHGVPAAAAHFLRIAFGSNAEVQVPAVYVRNWLRLLKQRGSSFLHCVVLCEQWQDVHDPRRGKRAPRSPGRWAHRIRDGACAGELPPAEGPGCQTPSETLHRLRPAR